MNKIYFKSKNFRNKSFLFTLFFLFFITITYSQTTHINPTGNGGFESGTTFTANGWSDNAPGNTSRNQWTVDNGASSGFSGSRCVYVTDNRGAGPAPNTYTISTTRVSHFWRNLTIPAGESNISLSFSWLNQGESSYDKIRVWLVPTSFTPVYDTGITTTGTAPTGNIQVGATNYSTQNTWTNTSIIIPSAYAGTTLRLVFEWSNDASGGTQPPGAIDNISLISSVPTDYCTYSTSSSLYWISNFTTTGGYSNINNTSTYSTGGYGNFSSTNIVNQSAGSAFNFSTTMNSGTHGVNIWVDWNNDFDFSDAGEKVYASGGYVSSASGSITIPALTVSGNYRMRVVANYSNTNPLDCGTSTYSEAEDYTIQVTPPPTCYTPSVTASSTGTTTGNASWTPSGSGTTPIGYEYVISTVNTTPAGSGSATTSTSTNFTGLTPSTTYYVFVRSNCGSGDFSTWSSSSFYTGYCIATNTSSSSYYISGINTTGGVANINNNPTVFSTNGYGNFSSQFVSQNSGLNFQITASHPSSTYGYSVWVDWNNDMDFNDPGEYVINTGYLSSPANIGSITIPAGTPAGDYRMRIRNAYLNNPPPSCGNHANGETEDYTVRSLGPLPCAGTPSAITVNIISQTEANITWTPASPAPANGYQYYLSTTNTPPNSGTTPTGSVAAGVTNLSLTGLVSGTTYYIWIRSNCGGGLGQGAWAGPRSFNMPTCAVGNSIGTTTLGCPSVVSGGLGLNGADPSPINCTSSGCVDLEASYLQLGNTTSYSVQPITYAPPYQFNCLKNPVSVNIDDRWSPVVNLPFNFCFYGNSYNSCVIGSNGVLSFNTSLAGASSGYTINNNIPYTSTSVPGNAIFGVFHDIDPSVGGEVGWELITLNSGCRALVASWNNVPMFSNNALLYTGMMVLYENTNIIEVYIKEKRVDGTWNDGNAIVGIQNAGATVATVAPGRNGLSADWTVTNEAWRFVPNGTSITSIKWYEGSGTSGPVVGTTDIINVCPSSTTTYTAEVSYSLCNGTTLRETEETTVTVNGSKTWNGSLSNAWALASNWSPSGIPTSSDCVVIPVTSNNPVISGINYNAQGHNLTVQNGARLTVNSNNNLTITDRVTVNPTGELYIQNAANLIQINNVSNTGNIRMDRTVNIRKLDYVYWSSPVQNFSSSSISPGTNNGYIFKWIPTVASSYTSNFGNWTFGNESMTLGKGYIVRGPDTFTSSLQSFTATFNGVPNNGNITSNIQRGTYNGTTYTGPSATLVSNNDDNWNLIGNPYPSSINAINFLTTNTNISGYIKLWTHGTLPSTATADPFYQDFVVNYNVNDYITYNATGTSSGPGVFDGNVGSGQSFFVLMNHTSTTTSESVSFNNSMRNSTYTNAQFFKTIEKSRIWIDLLNANKTESRRALIGYLPDATNEKDRLFDAIYDDKLSFNFYSINNNENYEIQGKSPELKESEIIPMGYKTNSSGLHTIALYALDGVFSDQNQIIYLEDKELGITYNLKDAPYSFFSNEGEFNNRFQLKFNTSKLDQIEENEENVSISNLENLTIISENSEIESIQVHDIIGRLLINKNNIKNKLISLDSILKSNSTLLINITFTNGKRILTKTMY